MDKKLIINSLKKLCSIDSIPVDSATKEHFDYSPINDYIECVSLKVKPETAATELIKSLFSNMIDNKIAYEANYEGDFIDIIIRPNENIIAYPVCIELKPFFRLNKEKNILKQSDFTYESHAKQIQKYLSKKNVEYVILTNINKAYIFNRVALIDYKPFKEIQLFELFEKLLDYDSFWDVIRRYEDEVQLMDLDALFFKDLKKWFAEFDNIKFKEHNTLSKNEMIVLFLNKFIFIKTLEDFGLIPYSFIKEQYSDFSKKWKTKSDSLVFKHFFSEIENFFEIYYDSELFNTNFWDFIVDTETNVSNFKNTFENILGFDEWSLAFSKGLVHYNYRQINEDIFGKAYETWIAENSKDEGIFYTPATITEYMSKLLVDTLFDEPINELVLELKSNNPNQENINFLINKINNIRIIDSSSGSGSFLIKCLREIYSKYEMLNKASAWVNYTAKDVLSFDMPDNVRIVNNFREKMNFIIDQELVLISKIILNHIFAVDKDERAIDIAKTNMWKEAVKLNPRIYNYTRLNGKKIHILPNLEMNFLCGDSLTDFDFSEQVKIIESEFKDDIKKLFVIRNNYINDPYNPEIIKEATLLKNKIRERLIKEHSEFKDSLFYPLEFFFCFFDENGNTLNEDEQGFDGIISNPPWEAIKPVKKEFGKLNKQEMDILNFNKWFDKKSKSDADFNEKWSNYVAHYTKYSNYLYSKYEKQSSGDPNYYKFFMERDFQLIKQNATYCLLVPSGFQTDEGSNLLRELIIEKYLLKELNSFENRGYFSEDKAEKVKLFPDVDSRFKFSIVFAQKKNLNGDKHSFKAKFYLQDPKDLYNGGTIHYDIKKIKQFSPDKLSIMEFRSEKDYEVCLKIKDKHKWFSELEYSLRAEFHMTNDSIMFHPFNEIKNFKDEKYLQLYEGKMIHQFNSAFGKARYFIKEEEGRTELLRKVLYRIKNNNDLQKEDFENVIIPNDLLLDYQTYRLVYRAIGSSTNERTLISSILPPNVFIGHSMNHIVNLDYIIENNIVNAQRINYNDLIYIMSLFNSLTLNYYIRNKVSANLTMNFIYELPIAMANEDIKQRIIELGFNLQYRKSNKNDYEDLKNELNVKIDSKRHLADMRAELEIIIAKKLYNLDFNDWEYLSSTFHYGGKSDTKAELDEIIRISKEMWDRI